MNNKSGLKIHIETNLRTRDVSIYAMEDYGQEEINYHMEGGELVQSLIQNRVGQDVRPLLVLPYKFYMAFEQALIEEASQQNRKTENHHRLEGTLAATIKHLEDLRVIVFSEYPTKPNQ